MELQRVCKASAWSCRETCRKWRPDAHRLALLKTLGLVLSFGGSREGSPVSTHPINIEILQEFCLCPLAGDLLPSPAEHCKASCKDNSYSLLTALFPRAGGFVLLFSPPCTSHPLPHCISVGHLPHVLSFSCSCCRWR